MPGKPSKQWLKREELREKGQFWTPAWVAEAMVSYATRDAALVFDPAFGAGAFAVAARRVAGLCQKKIRFSGCELHQQVLVKAREAGVLASDLSRVQIADFLTLSKLPRGASVVANPPYIRHHRLGKETKGRLRQMAVTEIGRPLDGRAGLHVYFLVHALHLLQPKQSLAFILPADVCEGVFAATLWAWIARAFRLDAVVTFAPDATPFPGVDTNPVVLMLQRAGPQTSYKWSRVKRSGGDAFLSWVMAGMPNEVTDDLVVESRDLRVGVTSGVARRTAVDSSPEFILGDLLKVMRGVATGANEFFCMTAADVHSSRIPHDFFVRSVGRTRDIPGDRISAANLDQLDGGGRATYLLAPDGRPLGEFPAALRKYLERGISQGLPERPLIAQRRPWYKMERRTPPPFLFAYLGRRNARFIFNEARAWPLTGFLCVYPGDEEAPLDRLWRLLQDPACLEALHAVAKSYGSGALKVEPRALERLPLPARTVRDLGLDKWASVANRARRVEQRELVLTP